MLRTETIKLWCRVHAWTSLICTAFLLLLCVTGLPLVFAEEIDEIFGAPIKAASMPEGTPNAPLDRVVAAALGKRPGEIVRFVSWSKDEPHLVFVTIVPKPTSPPDDFHVIVVDERTAEVLGQPNFRDGFMAVVRQLHIDMFAGMAGQLFLGFMGLLFVVAIVSGVVVYAPFMRRLEFGTVRKEKSRRIRWLDLHNLVGVVTVAWALVVGTTGIINCCAELVLKVWQRDQLAEMIAPYAGRQAPDALGSLEHAVVNVRAAAPGMAPSFIAYPSSQFSSKHHYAVFLRGDSPLTSRVLKPMLVDAVTGELTDVRELPWYMKTVFLSQPLHFGDYGGLPLKIVWALLDVVTIVVLGSGLYLWISRRKSSSVETRIAAL